MVNKEFGQKMKKNNIKKFVFKDKSKLFYAGFSVFVAVLMIGSSVWALTITQKPPDGATPGTDTTLEVIRCSNGNLYQATASNLQSAIDSAGENGEVLLPSNVTFEITESLIPIYINHSGLTFYSEGNTILNFSGTGDVWDVQIGGTGEHGLIEFYDCDYVTVKNLELDGNHGWNTTPYFNHSFRGIVIQNSNHSTVQNCHIHHFTEGIAFDGQIGGQGAYGHCSFNVIEDNHIHHIGNISDNNSNGHSAILFDGASMTKSHNVIQRNEIHDVREHGIRIYEGLAYYNQYLSNTIKRVNLGDWDNDGSPHGSGITIEGNHSFVANNVVYGNREMTYGISVSASDAGNCHNGTLYNNKFIDVDFPNYSDAVCIDAEYWIVDNNYIIYQGTGTHGIFMNDDAIHCTVIKNTIDAVYSFKINAAQNNTFIKNELVGHSIQYIDKDGRNNYFFENNFLELSDGDKHSLSSGATIANNTYINNIGFFDYNNDFVMPTSAPNNPVDGSMYVNTTTGDIGVYDGSAWKWN